MRNSFIGMGIGPRMAVAAGILVLVWLLVIWAGR